MSAQYVQQIQEWLDEAADLNDRGQTKEAFSKLLTATYGLLLESAFNTDFSHTHRREHELRGRNAEFVTRLTGGRR